MTRARDIADLAGGGTLLTRQLFTATAGQTTFTPSAGYNPGALEVFMNGLMLLASDYTATNSSTVVLGVAANAGDEVEILTYQINTIGDTVSASNGGTFNSDVIFDDNILVGNTDTSPYDRTSGNAIAIGDGLISSAQSGGNAAIFNRMTNDGSIVGFRKDGTSVGSIQTRGGAVSTLILDPRTNGGGLTGTANAVMPTSNAGAIGDANTSLDLGASGYAFRNAYLSGGVYLGGTAAANYMDDYEEGTWTPITSSGTMSGGFGSYVKIGSFVTLIFRWSSISSGSGQVSISGLPFTRSTSSHLGNLSPASGNCMFDGINTTRGIAPYLGGNNMTFYGNGSGNSNTWWYLQHSDANGSGQPLEVYGSIWYYTDQ